MKLLLDANLSYRMIPALSNHFEIFHVDNIGLPIPGKDIQIWEYAKANNCIIITNDEDFLDFSNIHGFPPKVVLLKTGNQGRLFIANLLIIRKEEIEALANSKELGVLELI